MPTTKAHQHIYFVKLEKYTGVNNQLDVYPSGEADNLKVISAEETMTMSKLQTNPYPAFTGQLQKAIIY